MPDEFSRLSRRVDSAHERIDDLYELLGTTPPPPQEEKTRWERSVAVLSTLLLSLGAFLTPILVVVVSKQ